MAKKTNTNPIDPNKGYSPANLADYIKNKRHYDAMHNVALVESGSKKEQQDLENLMYNTPADDVGVDNIVDENLGENLTGSAFSPKPPGKKPKKSLSGAGNEMFGFKKPSHGVLKSPTDGIAKGLNTFFDEETKTQNLVSAEEAREFEKYLKDKEKEEKLRPKSSVDMAIKEKHTVSEYEQFMLDQAEFNKLAEKDVSNIAKKIEAGWNKKGETRLTKEGTFLRSAEDFLDAAVTPIRKFSSLGVAMFDKIFDERYFRTEKEQKRYDELNDKLNVKKIPVIKEEKKLLQAQSKAHIELADKKLAAIDAELDPLIEKLNNMPPVGKEYEALSEQVFQLSTRKQNLESTKSYYDKALAIYDDAILGESRSVLGNLWAGLSRDPKSTFSLGYNTFNDDFTHANLAEKIKEGTPLTEEEQMFLIARESLSTAENSGLGSEAYKIADGVRQSAMFMGEAVLAGKGIGSAFKTGANAGLAMRALATVGEVSGKTLLMGSTYTKAMDHYSNQIQTLDKVASENNPMYKADSFEHKLHNRDYIATNEDKRRAVSENRNLKSSIQLELTRLNKKVQEHLDKGEDIPEELQKDLFYAQKNLATVEKNLSGLVKDGKLITPEISKVDAGIKGFVENATENLAEGPGGALIDKLGSKLGARLGNAVPVEKLANSKAGKFITEGKIGQTANYISKKSKEFARTADDAFFSSTKAGRLTGEIYSHVGPAKMIHSIPAELAEEVLVTLTPQYLEDYTEQLSELGTLSYYTNIMASTAMMGAGTRASGAGIHSFNYMFNKDYREEYGAKKAVERSLKELYRGLDESTSDVEMAKHIAMNTLGTYYDYNDYQTEIKNLRNEKYEGDKKGLTQEERNAKADHLEKTAFHNIALQAIQTGTQSNLKKSLNRILNNPEAMDVTKTAAQSAIDSLTEIEDTVEAYREYTNVNDIVNNRINKQLVTKAMEQFTEANKNIASKHDLEKKFEEVKEKLGDEYDELKGMSLEDVGNIDINNLAENHLMNSYMGAIASYDSAFEDYFINNINKSIQQNTLNELEKEYKYETDPANADAIKERESKKRKEFIESQQANSMTIDEIKEKAAKGNVPLTQAEQNRLNRDAIDNPVIAGETALSDSEVENLEKELESLRPALVEYVGRRQDIVTKRDAIAKQLNDGTITADAAQIALDAIDKEDADLKAEYQDSLNRKAEVEESLNKETERRKVAEEKKEKKEKEEAQELNNFIPAGYSNLLELLSDDTVTIETLEEASKILEGNIISLWGKENKLFKKGIGKSVYEGLKKIFKEKEKIQNDLSSIKDLLNLVTNQNAKSILESLQNLDTLRKAIEQAKSSPNQIVEIPAEENVSPVQNSSANDLDFLTEVNLDDDPDSNGENNISLNTEKVGVEVNEFDDSEEFKAPQVFSEDNARHVGFIEILSKALVDAQSQAGIRSSFGGVIAGLRSHHGDHFVEQNFNLISIAYQQAYNTSLDEETLNLVYAQNFAFTAPIAGLEDFGGGVSTINTISPTNSNPLPNTSLLPPPINEDDGVDEDNSPISDKSLLRDGDVIANHTKSGYRGNELKLGNVSGLDYEETEQGKETVAREVNETAKPFIDYRNMLPGTSLTMMFDIDYLLDGKNYITLWEGLERPNLDGKDKPTKRTIPVRQALVEIFKGTEFDTWPKIEAELIKYAENRDKNNPLFQNEEFLKIVPVGTTRESLTGEGPDPTSPIPVDDKPEILMGGLNSYYWFNNTNVALYWNPQTGVYNTEERENRIEENRKTVLSARREILNNGSYDFKVSERSDKADNVLPKDAKGNLLDNNFYGLLDSFGGVENQDNIKNTIGGGYFKSNGNTLKANTTNIKGEFVVGNKVVKPEQIQNYKRFMDSAGQGKIFILYQTGIGKEGEALYTARFVTTNHHSRQEVMGRANKIKRGLGALLHSDKSELTREQKKAVFIAFKNKFGFNIATKSNFDLFADLYPDKTGTGFKQDYNVNAMSIKDLTNIPLLENYDTAEKFIEDLLMDESPIPTRPKEAYVMGNFHLPLKFTSITKDGETIYTEKAQPYAIFDYKVDGIIGSQGPTQETLKQQKIVADLKNRRERKIRDYHNTNDESYREILRKEIDDLTKEIGDTVTLVKEVANSYVTNYPGNIKENTEFFDTVASNTNNTIDAAVAEYQNFIDTFVNEDIDSIIDMMESKGLIQKECN